VTAVERAVTAQCTICSNPQRARRPPPPRWHPASRPALREPIFSFFPKRPLRQILPEIKKFILQKVCWPSKMRVKTRRLGAQLQT
jgi:hypothetical protein